MKGKETARAEAGAQAEGINVLLEEKAAELPARL